MKKAFTLLFVLLNIFCKAQNPINLSAYSNKSEAKILVSNNVLTISWPVGKNNFGKLLLDLSKEKPLFKSIQIKNKEIAAGLDPAFVLTVDKRDLISLNGWNIFFDKVPLNQHEYFNLNFVKDSASIISE